MAGLPQVPPPVKPPVPNPHRNLGIILALIAGAIGLLWLQATFNPPPTARPNHVPPTKIKSRGSTIKPDLLRDCPGLIQKGRDVGVIKELDCRRRLLWVAYSGWDYFNANQKSGLAGCAAIECRSTDSSYRIEVRDHHSGRTLATWSNRSLLQVP